MLTLTIVLAVTSFVLGVVCAMERCKPWLPILILSLAVLVQAIPK